MDNNVACAEHIKTQKDQVTNVLHKNLRSRKDKRKDGEEGYGTRRRDDVYSKNYSIIKKGQLVIENIKMEFQITRRTISRPFWKWNIKLIKGFYLSCKHYSAINSWGLFNIVR